MSDSKGLEALLTEIIAATEEAHALGNRLTGLALKAERLEAHPLAVRLIREAESLAYRVGSYGAAGALRCEQARRRWNVVPLSPSLATGRCPHCLAVPVLGDPSHETWCLTVKTHEGRHDEG